MNQIKFKRPSGRIGASWWLLSTNEEGIKIFNDRLKERAILFGLKVKDEHNNKK